MIKVNLEQMGKMKYTVIEFITILPARKVDLFYDTKIMLPFHKVLKNFLFFTNDCILKINI